MWCDKLRAAGADARNAVFYGDEAINRSPCGTASSARMAHLVAKSRLVVGAEFVHESIIGTLFNCRVEAATKVGSHVAILPSVAGWARITGHNTIYVDDRDPSAHGFQVK
jgi:4-hydroxyproline epimerase